MKRVFAVLMAVILLVCLGTVAVSAATSPVGDESHLVAIKDGADAKVVVKSVKDGKTVSVPSSATGTFNKWTFFKYNGTPAVAGEDYVLTSGSTTSTTIVVRPLVDLIICGNYNGTDTVPPEDPGSPQTGDFVAVGLIAVMLAAGTCTLVARKKLAK